MGLDAHFPKEFVSNFARKGRTKKLSFLNRSAKERQKTPPFLVPVFLLLVRKTKNEKRPHACCIGAHTHVLRRLKLEGI